MTSLRCQKVFSAATGLDISARILERTDGSQLRYDDVVIATGARPCPSPWGQPPGLHYLRRLDDASALDAGLRRGGPVVVIGAGFVGTEVAAAARAAGVGDVTIVDPAPMPLDRAVPPIVGARVARLHRDHGVRMRLGVGVDAIDTRAGELVVRLADGTRLVAATVVVGIGVSANDDWLRGSTVERHTAGPSFAVISGDAEWSVEGAVTVNWPHALVICRQAVIDRASLTEVGDTLDAARSSPASQSL